MAKDKPDFLKIVESIGKRSINEWDTHNVYFLLGIPNVSNTHQDVGCISSNVLPSHLSHLDTKDNTKRIWYHGYSNGVEAVTETPRKEDGQLDYSQEKAIYGHLLSQKYRADALLSFSEIDKVLNSAVACYFYVFSLQLVFIMPDGKTYGIKSNEIRSRRCDQPFQRRFEEWYFETDPEEIPEST